MGAQQKGNEEGQGIQWWVPESKEFPRWSWQRKRCPNPGINCRGPSCRQSGQSGLSQVSLPSPIFNPVFPPDHQESNYSVSHHYYSSCHVASQPSSFFFPFQRTTKAHCYSFKYGLKIYSTTWELARNANSWVLPHNYWISISGWMSVICVLINLQMIPNACLSLRSSDIANFPRSKLLILYPFCITEWKLYSRYTCKTNM